MRNLNVVIIIFIIFSVSCKDSKEPVTGSGYNIHNPASASGSKSSKTVPEIEFRETEFNLGTLIQGEQVSHSFRFTNTGGSNLVISKVDAPCGCTSPTWTREPIQPGGTGFIEVVFDSRNRSGEQIQSVRVYSNTQPNYTDLVIRCNVVD